MKRCIQDKNYDQNTIRWKWVTEYQYWLRNLARYDFWTKESITPSVEMLQNYVPTG